MVDELEEVILALKAAGWAVPSYKILDTGVFYFDNRQQEASDTPVYSEEPRGNVS
jgi:hypothetical protein